VLTHSAPPLRPDLSAFEGVLKMCGIPPIDELMKHLKEGGMQVVSRILCHILWRGVPFFEQPVELLLGFGEPLEPSFPFDPLALTFEV